MAKRPPLPEGEGALRAEIARLNKVVAALVRRAEQTVSSQRSEFDRFQRTVLLENQVRVRTRELEAALQENQRMMQEVRRLNEQLREQSIRDPLTGLYNRRYLEDTLLRELTAARRRGEPVSLVLGDIDHFKRVNDRYGHPAGDAVLRLFADLLVRHSRGSDICCRYGGEEFLVVLPGFDEAGAAARAEQWRTRLADAPLAAGGQSVACTASFGVATFPREAASPEALIAAADQALYAAKDGGRNRVARRSRLSHDGADTAQGELTPSESS